MLGRSALLLAVTTTLACASPAEETQRGATSAVIEGKQDGEPTGLPEVVQVLVNNQARDYCTGVLVSPTRVLTAAHCTGAATFVVKAPYVPGEPRSAATKGGVVHHSRAFNEEVWKEDAAILELATPIAIDRYPELRDVGELGDATLTGVAVGRQYEDRDAPLVKSTPITVRDGAPDGYTTGLGSEYYSSGGDSGGPLFLVEEGEIQHVVIGIERQPDPPREWFTRITPGVKALVER